ncbi:MAG: HAD family hydrolase [Mycoplasmoidaceae bacterium]
MDTSKKLIIADLDGTLLNNKSELTEKTIKVIKKINELGHIFCISTGRPLRSAIKFYNQLGLNTIISTLNGGVLSNPSDKNFNDLFFTFHKDVLKRILFDKTVQDLTNYIVVESLNSTYLISKKEDLKINQKFLNKFHIDKKTLIHTSDSDSLFIEEKIIQPVSVLISTTKENIDKISFSIKTILNTFVIRVWDDVGDKKNEKVIIELNTLFSTKGTSMKYLSSFYGRQLNRIYAFGDGENDLEMLKSSENAFAMKNAAASVKLISYKITGKSNDNDGVALQLMKELNINKL